LKWSKTRKETVHKLSQDGQFETSIYATRR
jgi:hypothetical protein